MFGDRIAAKLHYDRVLFCQLRQRSAELDGVDNLLLQPRLLRGRFVRGPHVLAVHLSRRDEDRQFHQPVVETGLAPKIIIYARHGFGHGRTVEAYGSRPEGIGRQVRLDRWKTVARLGMDVLWEPRLSGDYGGANYQQQTCQGVR